MRSKRMKGVPGLPGFPASPNTSGGGSASLPKDTLYVSPQFTPAGSSPPYFTDLQSAIDYLANLTSPDSSYLILIYPGSYGNTIIPSSITFPISIFGYFQSLVNISSFGLQNSSLVSLSNLNVDTFDAGSAGIVAFENCSITTVGFAGTSQISAENTTFLSLIDQDFVIQDVVSMNCQNCIFKYYLTMNLFGGTFRGSENTFTIVGNPINPPPDQLLISNDFESDSSSFISTVTISGGTVVSNSSTFYDAVVFIGTDLTSRRSTFKSSFTTGTIPSGSTTLDLSYSMFDNGFDLGYSSTTSTAGGTAQFDNCIVGNGVTTSIGSYWVVNLNNAIISDFSIDTSNNLAPGSTTVTANNSTFNLTQTIAINTTDPKVITFIANNSIFKISQGSSAINIANSSSRANLIGSVVNGNSELVNYSSTNPPIADYSITFLVPNLTSNPMTITLSDYHLPSFNDINYNVVVVDLTSASPCFVSQLTTSNFQLSGTTGDGFQISIIRTNSSIS